MLNKCIDNLAGQKYLSCFVLGRRIFIPWSVVLFFLYRKVSILTSCFQHKYKFKNKSTWNFVYQLFFDSEIGKCGVMGWVRGRIGIIRISIRFKWWGNSKWELYPSRGNGFQPWRTPCSFDDSSVSQQLNILKNKSKLNDSIGKSPGSANNTKEVCDTSCKTRSAKRKKIEECLIWRNISQKMDFT